MKGRLTLFLVLLILFSSMGLIAGDAVQSAVPDSTGTIDSVKTAASAANVEGEIILDEIQITGKVEKPGVIIMPKRIEPELDKLTLKRSFQKEVKESMGDMPKPESVLQEIDHVKSIKKTVERKRN